MSDAVLNGGYLRPGLLEAADIAHFSECDGRVTAVEIVYSARTQVRARRAFAEGLPTLTEVLGDLAPGASIAYCRGR